MKRTANITKEKHDNDGVVTLERRNVATNTFMLYLMTFAKIILPLLTFPYLTRVLSVSVFGSYSYVRNCSNYFILILEFGFMYSTTTDIVNANRNKKKINYICSETFTARILLCFAIAAVYLIMCFSIEILRETLVFSLLSIIPVLLTCLLPDYLFRGLEVMDVLTIRFLVSKSLSTALVFLFVKDSSDLVWIPILDTFGTLISIFLTYSSVKKMGVTIRMISIKEGIIALKKSFIYFLSDFASTMFSLLNTFLIGIFLSAEDVSYWGVAYTLVSAIQSLYYPITNAIYPRMVNTKSLKLLKIILFIFLPIVFLGCVCSYYLAPFAIEISSGGNYHQSIPIFRILLIMLFFSFPALMLGWPALGALGKVKETTFTTIMASVLHCVLLVILTLFNEFNLINIAIARAITEFSMFIFRFIYVLKYKRLFN